MSGELTPLITALRAAANAGENDLTRIATVTGGTATTISVKFDGESVASSRAYPKLYAPSFVNDRVVMLRTGSTWTAIGRIPSTSPDTSPDTGWIALTLASGWSNYGSTWEQAAYRRLNGVVYLRGLLIQGSGATMNGGALIANLPVGFRSGTDQHLAVGGINGSPGIINIMANGNIQVNTAVGNAQWLSLRVTPFPADQ